MKEITRLAQNLTKMTIRYPNPRFHWNQNCYLYPKYCSFIMRKEFRTGRNVPLTIPQPLPIEEGWSIIWNFFWQVQEFFFFIYFHCCALASAQVTSLLPYIYLRTDVSPHSDRRLLASELLIIFSFPVHKTHSCDHSLSWHAWYDNLENISLQKSPIIHIQFLSLY